MLIVGIIHSLLSEFNHKKGSLSVKHNKDQELSADNPLVSQTLLDPES